MNFLIVGANFYNKGAQLMLLSLINSLKQRYPNDTICVSPTIGRAAQIKELGVSILDRPLFHVGDVKNFRRYFKSSKTFKVLKEVRDGKVRRRGIKGFLRLFKELGERRVKWNDIDVILDVSGFAFTDQWGIEPLENLNVLLDECQKNGTQYIFMPQAFGPFEKEGMADSMRAVLKKSSLVFARDAISYEYLIALLNDEDKIKLAPDITLTYGQKNTQIENYCCLIPNERILDQGAEAWGKEYEKLIDQIIEQICSTTDLKIYILTHDTGGKDATLVKTILGRHTNSKISEVHEDNPLKLKELLAKSHFVIGSRFHGLASALSSNVPSIGLGWSHKYNLLFADYALPEYSFLAPDTNILSVLNTLLIEDERTKIRARLKGVNETINTASEEMWKTIQAIL
jgi:polysaccharide pyruvyl transferase WcaK-like protein